MPTNKYFFQLEEQNTPQFNKIISEIASSKSVAYLDFSCLEGNYQYIDGHHLDEQSAISFSQYLGDSIATLIEKY
jgi:hypothetical protein